MRQKSKLKLAASLRPTNSQRRRLFQNMLPLPESRRSLMFDADGAVAIVRVVWSDVESTVGQLSNTACTSGETTRPSEDSRFRDKPKPDEEWTTSTLKCARTHPWLTACDLLTVYDVRLVHMLVLQSRQVPLSYRASPLRLPLLPSDSASRTYSHSAICQSTAIRSSLYSSPQIQQKETQWQLR
jgi:hypothetical protein